MAKHTPDDFTLHEKASQVVFGRLGSNLEPPVTLTEDTERVSELLEDYPIGGLMAFRGDRGSAPTQFARLQRLSEYPLLVASDIERGVGQQIEGGTTFPHAMAYGALDEGAEEAVEEMARITAREALACGIQITFSPIADVNRDARNPIIGTRSYSADPDMVARLVKAFNEASQEVGHLTTGKHFPGHGNTSLDSHNELPSINSSREELEQYDLPPFRAASEVGVDLMMTAHIAYPALDDSGAPATLSPAIMKTLLREGMSYEGAIITDSLIMGGIRTLHDTPGERAVDILKAGIDILLDPPEPRPVIEGIKRGVEEGALSEERLNQAVGRVWTLKNKLLDRFGSSIFDEPSEHFPTAEIGAKEHRLTARRQAYDVINVIGESDPDVFPIDPKEAAREGLLVVLLHQHKDPDVVFDEPLSAAVHTTFPGAAYAEVDDEAGEATFDRLREHARRVKHVVVAPVVKPAAFQGQGLQPLAQEFVRDLIEERPVVLASLGSPYVLDDFPKAAARICTYSDAIPSQRALADVLAGREAEEIRLQDRASGRSATG
jgi:beta-glucosidase-like glycosyl hydrolase